MKYRLRNTSTLPGRLATGLSFFLLGCFSLAAAPQIIIKADDLRDVRPGWQRFVDYIEDNEMKATIGIITSALENVSQEDILWIRALHDAGTIEFWHHGYGHIRDSGTPTEWWEYRNRSYELQKQDFDRGMELGREKLGITFRTFGAPYNQTDEVTTQVLEEEPDMRVWMFPSAASRTPDNTKLILNRISAVNLEDQAGIVVPFEQFSGNYPAHANQPVLTLQAHPLSWDEGDWERFGQIMDFLKDEGATFTTAMEYFGIEDTDRAIVLDIPVDTEAGVRYRIQRSENLEEWETDGAQFIGTGERMIPQRIFYGRGSVFYRAMKLAAGEPLFVNTFEDLADFNEISPAAATADDGVVLVDATTTPPNLAGTGSGMRYYSYSPTVNVRAFQDFAFPDGFRFEVTFYNNNSETLDPFHGPRLRFGNTGGRLQTQSHAAFEILLRKDDRVRAAFAGGNTEMNVAPATAHVLTLYVNAQTSGQITYEGPTSTRTLDPMSYDAYVNGVLIGTTENGMPFMNGADYDQAQGIGRFGLNVASTHIGGDYTFDDLSITQIGSPPDP